MEVVHVVVVDDIVVVVIIFITVVFVVTAVAEVTGVFFIYIYVDFVVVCFGAWSLFFKASSRD